MLPRRKLKRNAKITPSSELPACISHRGQYLLFVDSILSLGTTVYNIYIIRMLSVYIELGSMVLKISNKARKTYLKKKVSR